jgi:hypothetical protein
MSDAKCCANPEWTPVADFGHAAGFDLDLGRCANCGRYLMSVYYYGASNYVPVSDDRAKEWLALQEEDPLRLKAALKKWID